MSILTEQAKSKLLPYQVKHAETLCSILLTKCRALDLSQTGTGKSYVSAAICASLNLRPLIISPKSLITMWPLHTAAETKMKILLLSATLADKQLKVKNKSFLIFKI